MCRKVTLLTIFIALALAATAQTNGALTSNGVEPVRPRMVPYPSTADAERGNASRYAVKISEWSEEKGDGVITYTSHFPMDVSWLNRQVLLRIGFADSALRVVVNGKEVGSLACGAYGAEFNITKRVEQGRNEVKIIVDTAAAANRLYAPRSQKKGVNVGHIADVEVLCPPTIRVRDVVCNTRLNEAGDAIVEVAIPVKCDALNRKSAVVNYTLRLNDTLVVGRGRRDISLAMRNEDTLRFATTLPKSYLWSATTPNTIRLDIESRIDNRVAECVSRRLALRSLEVKRDNLYVNGAPVKLNLVEWGAVADIAEVVKFGYNGIVVDCGYGVEDILRECEKRGLYVVLRTPIDTTNLGDHIRKGGNPTNDPAWGKAFAERTMGAIDATKGCGAIVGYSLGYGKTCGVNIYDIYLLAKGALPHHIILYEGANGEWCSDRVALR